MAELHHPILDISNRAKKSALFHLTPTFNATDSPQPPPEDLRIFLTTW